MVKNLKLKCPSCSSLMATVVVKSHYDFPIIIEQCKKCGGIWFHNIDFHKVKIGEANNIEILDKNKLQELSLIKNQNLYCPKDNSILTQFKDQNFPKEIIIEKCSLCNGFWFNRGKFLEYQDKIKEKRKELKNPQKKSNSELEIQVMKLLENSSDSAKYNTMKNIANFLSTPIDPISNRTFSDNSNTEKVNQTIGIVFGVLKFILQLFLR